MEREAGESRGVGRTHIIKRPRLTRLLDETDARIILLVAPAGYGKTTLAREWLGGRLHGWYRGNSATSDVAALALGLGRAASAVVPGASDRLATRLRISRSPSEEVVVLAQLFAEDLGAWPSNAWLAFDDYQFACDSEPAEQFVEILVSNSDVRLLIASRSRPRWATVRRVLYGEITEMGRALLAMNEEEARVVLSDRRTDESVGLLAMADGWPALIALATLAEEASLPGATSPEELYSFFAEELYHGAPSDLQQALRRLALAPYVTPDIAETLIRDNSESVISNGLELGFLVTGRTRLELHPLLRSFLTSRFRRRCDDPTGELVTELSHVLIARQEWDEVFELASRFADALLLVKLFEMSLYPMLDQARVPTLERWIQTARARKLDAPALDLAEAEVAFRRGELARAEAFACQAARTVDGDDPLASRALWLAGTSAHLTSRDEAALEHFKKAQDAATTNGDARSAIWGQFTASESLDHETDAATLLADFTQRSGTTVDELLRIATGRFRLATLCGGIDQTIDHFRSLTHLAEHSHDPLIRSSFLNSNASLLVLAGHYEEALAAAETAMGFIRDASLDFALPFALLTAAASNLGLRLFRTCRTNLSLFERTTLRSAFLICNMTAINARLRLATNQISEAVCLLDQTYSVAKTQRVTHAEHVAWWAFAEAVAGNARDATTLLRRAESLSQRIEVSTLVSWTKAVLASDKPSSRRTAEAAFQITVETGNIDAFVTAYRAHPRLLDLLTTDRAHRERIGTILSCARDHALAERVGLNLPSPLGPGRLKQLTRREREVLDLVSQGLTNKEIGRTLYITEGTVKVHVRKICRKLGARSRTEAAMRDAELSD